MKEVLDEQLAPNALENGKLFTDRYLWAGVFLGGPLAAGYFFAKNFRVLGESEKVAPTWSISIISTICIFGGLSLIPDNVRIPNFVIPAAYTSVAYFLFKHYQAEKVERLLNSGAKEHGIWRVLGVVLINIAVLVTVGMIIFALVDIFTTIEE